MPGDSWGPDRGFPQPAGLFLYNNRQQQQQQQQQQQHTETLCRLARARSARSLLVYIERKLAALGVRHQNYGKI